jgi:hypothetical protein
VRGLRSRGIDVVAAADSGMIRRKDQEHLSWATVQGRTLYSFNVGDYHEIHTEWAATGRNHAGIVLAQQKRHSTGEQALAAPDRRRAKWTGDRIGGRVGPSVRLLEVTRTRVF